MSLRSHRLPLLLAGTLAALTTWTGSAQALPPGGASPDTPGTRGSITQKTLAPGATITFRIAGFPASEVVSVKIDDGEFCSAKGVHGACVVHQQKSGKDGSMAGSFQLPADLAPGQHWLRFLASSEMLDGEGNYLGVKPYSLRGDTIFTVKAAGSTAAKSANSGTGGASNGGVSTPSGAPRGTAASSAGTTGGAGQSPAASTSNADSAQVQSEISASGPLRVPAPSATASTSESGSIAMVPESDENATVAAEVVEAERFPWLGAGVLLLCAAFAAALLVRGRSVRRA